MTIDTSIDISNHKPMSELMTRGVEETIIEESFRKKLESKNKLRIKFGVDPTAPDLHLGHTVPLRKLRKFQDLGHQAVLIFGDFTATIGDPSARKEARKVISREEVKNNMKTYLDQVGKILDMKTIEIHRNGEWYDNKNTDFIFELTSKVTVQRVLARDDFKKRLAHDQDVNMLETIYPLLQGYDSVSVDADIEIGGTDQKFNLLIGRKIQKAYNKKEQDIMTLWLLEGTDGVSKMSKSLGNFIGISEEPNIMYGKIMSIPDELIVKYFRLLTDVSTEEVDDMLKRFRRQVSAPFDPRREKARLAFEIVKMYHSEKAAKEADAEFDKVFSKREKPTDMPVVKINAKDMKLDDLLIKCELTTSKSEARRLIGQGGVEVNDEKITDFNKTIEIKEGMVLKVGKRKFVKIQR